ncbi:N-acetylmuramic acid 6-phosphate etherase [Solibacillus isronensis B3W22]|uniref:N-acetylmuramic acid 6-phosphate etherase n=1 Tax=Solibacillus isronensis B3W22 TaxID=1224748 RepID=K1LMJ8_9BACL|nr:N-acetylmuramic acid 6-phosphate etherase [Solibacillus isronensis]AMO86955.1 N-acetylmuramic acid 6-phosphate etherase [Solibacillus silvestris]EKB45459.1 N-acetylmuramic acid 6-phosphate etherase [Solibacillus isronensis B3W22]
MNYDQLTTEKRNDETLNLDVMPISDILQIMNKEDMQVVKSVEQVLPIIEKVIKRVVENISNGGRLFYIGAGTSGRLGMLDASECPPTFMTDPELVQTVMAGGKEAFFQAVENAEDRLEDGINKLKEKNITPFDSVIGITASGTTPFVMGALQYAQSVGAFTVSLTSNINSEVSRYAEEAIEVVVGPEILTGSTRLKAATSHKMILNMISTASMVQLGKVYENLMVDVHASNKKLIERAKRIVIAATDCKYAEAEQVLEKTKYAVKPAIVMLKTNQNYERVIHALEQVDGHTRKAILLLNNS